MENASELPVKVASDGEAIDTEEELFASMAEQAVQLMEVEEEEAKAKELKTNAASPKAVMFTIGKLCLLISIWQTVVVRAPETLRHVTQTMMCYNVFIPL